jgi:TonB family protein
MIIMLLLAFLIWLIVPHIHIPEVKRAEAEAVPERLAKMVVQQKVIPPPPKPVAEKQEKTDVAKDATKPVEKVAQPVENEPKAVATDLQKSAAKARASQAIKDAGIEDALAGVRDMDVTAMSTPRGLPGQVGTGTGGLITDTKEAGTSRNLLTSKAGSGSGAGSAYAGGVSSGFGGGKAGGKGSAGMMGAGGGGGGGAGLQSVRSDIASATNVNAHLDKDGKGRRSQEDIRKTFDQYGGRLNNAYQRALRDNPTMQGTVRLKLTVAPDGSVTNVSVASSQLSNPELESKILVIVQGFNFGADNVAIWSGTHDLNFFPN